MKNIEAEITLLKSSLKTYYDSSAITGLVPKLYFKVEKEKLKFLMLEKLKINLKRVVLKYVISNRFDSKNLSNNLNEYKKEINNFH